MAHPGSFPESHQMGLVPPFGPSFPLETDVASISRPVYHVPSRSKFVFPSQLQKIKGSDASNVHDEEIAEDEAEFSDDEAEIAFKRAKSSFAWVSWIIGTSRKRDKPPQTKARSSVQTARPLLSET